MDDEKWMRIYEVLNSNLKGVEDVLDEAIETLKEKSFNRRIAFDLLLKVAEEKPEILLRYTDKLKKLIGGGFESVYVSMVLGRLSLRYPRVVDEETVSKIFDLLNRDEMKCYILLALSDIAISNPKLLSNHIQDLINLIKDRSWEVRWNTARVFVNLIESDLSLVKSCIDRIEGIAKNERFKPSVRVVAQVILNEFKKFNREQPS